MPVGSNFPKWMRAMRNEQVQSHREDDTGTFFFATFSEGWHFDAGLLRCAPELCQRKQPYGSSAVLDQSRIFTTPQAWFGISQAAKGAIVVDAQHRFEHP